ncbi:hypothetical protein I3842_07G157100 [Carya illinoinensis]|uniref:FHA domain-containing protein n=1 Tax=Carya illinoinensis TaxID=32201 RepID=A0A922ENR4_CARIL|nr:hypothetical protein I3842_07G157100 [Carya illinoinensis]KAG6704947.1 hypothetical protein I3842_07G157100 [Carya illinoinensis]
MGALSPASSWNPEDDLLLKNAVEAGASLESLAKGAVQFSRRFTVRELQDRWHSLLFDPVISAEASTHMIAIERSATTLPSKFNRFGNSKENKSIYGKRKVGSVRSCYYALRKRICNEPFNSMDLSFLVAPGNGNYIGNGDEILSGDPISDNFGLQGPNLDVMHPVFQQNLMDGGTIGSTAAAARAFHPGLQQPGEEDFHIGQDTIREETPHTFDKNINFTGNSSGAEELGQPEQFPAHILFKSDDLGMEPSSTIDRTDNDQGNICSDFEGNQVFNSPMSECDASFHSLGFSSPLHGLPLWRTVEGIAEPSMGVDPGLGEKNLHSGDGFELPDDDKARNATTSVYDGHLDCELKAEMPCDNLKSLASAEGYLAELSNSLLDFTNEEELLFMDVDGKDVIDKSYFDGLSSLLLNSPSDAGQDHTSSATEAETSVAQETYFKNPSIACLGELEDGMGSQCDVGHIVQDLGAQMLSSSLSLNSEFSDPSEGVICCMLNTEDPEIPCNDDFNPPNRFSPSSGTFVAQQSFQEANNPISSTVNDMSSSQRTREKGLVSMQKGGKKTGEFHSCSKMIGSHVSTGMGLKNPIGDGVTFELSNSDYAHVASKGGGSKQINSSSLSTDILRPTIPKEENAEVPPTKHLSDNQMDSFIKGPYLCSDSFRGCTRANANRIKQELDAPAAIQDYQSTQTEAGALDIAGPVENSPISDQEGLPIESDDEVPHYSDIEAMILDMDLDPEDQDLYSSEEVARYQHAKTKRAIVRLEQGAHSCMQRAIASHGAFAILYGRFSRHYIKKPEVLLGRATEDVTVDIDLGREGRINKISRRQAIIKMDKAGSFHLKNLGKCSISVNNKEVGPGQSLPLITSCLIEVRSHGFVNMYIIERYGECLLYLT